MKKLLNCIDRVGGFVLLACIVFGYIFAAIDFQHYWSVNVYAPIILLSSCAMLAFCLIYIFKAADLSWKVSKIVPCFWTFCIGSLKVFCKWMCSD